MSLALIQSKKAKKVSLRESHCLIEFKARESEFTRVTSTSSTCLNHLLTSDLRKRSPKEEIFCTHWVVSYHKVRFQIVSSHVKVHMSRKANGFNGLVLGCIYAHAAIRSQHFACVHCKPVEGREHQE